MQSQLTTNVNTITETESEKNYDAVVCVICENGDSKENNEIILCDHCDRGFHMMCINLTMLPPGNWYCGKCSNLPHEKKTKNTGTVIIYERVSSKGQDKPEYGRTGLDTQNRTLLTFVAEKNYRVKNTYVDIGSGQNVTKLKNNKFVDEMNEGDQLLVYSVSRLGRNVQQVMEELVNPLVQKGVIIVSVSENVTSNDSKFLELLKQAEQEGIAQGQKTRDAIMNRRKEGHYIGNPGYGWKVVKVLNNEQKEIRTKVENKEEQDVIKYIVNDSLKAGAMASDLNSKGKLKRGKEWTTSSVLKIRKEWAFMKNV